MRFCPHCQNELLWDADFCGSDAEDETDTLHLGYATSSAFSYSPWSGVRYHDAPAKKVRRAAGFELESRCGWC